MVTVVVHSPQGGGGTAERRQFTLPACAPALLESLERAGLTIEQALKDGQGALRITFNIKGKSVRSEVTLFE